MSVTHLIDDGIKLFEEGEYNASLNIFTQTLDGIIDKNQFIPQKVKIYYFIARCYFEKASKEKNNIQAQDLFNQAIRYFGQYLDFSEQLPNKQESIQRKANAQFWRGRCYFEQGRKASNNAEAQKLFKRAKSYFQKQFSLLRKSLDKKECVQQQVNTLYWIAGCYFKQAKNGKNNSKMIELLEKAIQILEKQLVFSNQLSNEQEVIQVQTNAYLGLGRCYFAQANRSEEKDKASILFSQYIKTKKTRISYSIFPDTNGQLNNEIKEAISSILAVLNISPDELSSIPIAHYTSANICEKLFGVNEAPSPMRMGSSTYMNDPSEGKSLLELLNLQELELENKARCQTHNAFFTCFSTRINDLNQFRLYGKEDSVEASGCCLVFNKKGYWLENADISISFASLNKASDKQDSFNGQQYPIKQTDTANYPLYQITYIAYQDEYISDNQCTFWLSSEGCEKFGIYLKQVGHNDILHQVRQKTLKEALNKLIKACKNRSQLTTNDYRALEYIRYLFKDFAFKDEEEFRLLKIEEIGADTIKYCEVSQSLYIPYADIRDSVDEVILGTNYERTTRHRKAEVFQHKMRKTCPDVKISRSSLPINANIPVKKHSS